jgi:predicted DNA-binding protein YlxM (UPF0122 family)
MKEYGVIIGDIIGSRSLENWDRTMNSVQNVIDEIKNTFHENIKAGPYFTAGDEFQCILDDHSKLYLVHKELRLRMPVRFRCGFGIGDIEGPISTDATMRGTAFYRAREAITKAKELDRDLVIISEESANAFDGLLNVLFHVVEDLFDNMTHRQMEVLRYYILNDRPKHRNVADHFNTSAQSISQVLIASRLSVVDEVESAIQTMLGTPSFRKLKKVKMLDSANSSKNG